MEKVTQKGGAILVAVAIATVSTIVAMWVFAKYIAPKMKEKTD